MEESGDRILRKRRRRRVQENAPQPAANGAGKDDIHGQVVAIAIAVAIAVAVSAAVASAVSAAAATGRSFSGQHGRVTLNSRDPGSCWPGRKIRFKK